MVWYRAGGGPELQTLRLQQLASLDEGAEHAPGEGADDALVARLGAACDAALAPLRAELLQPAPDPGHPGHPGRLHRKLSIYLILASGLGNPACIQVHVEIHSIKSTYVVYSRGRVPNQIK